jgi:hypothetical protein
VIQLNLILQSHLNENLKDEIADFKMKINQISELAELWLQVQVYWLYLERLFHDINLEQRPNKDFILYESIVKEFRVRIYVSFFFFSI